MKTARISREILQPIFGFVLGGLLFAIIVGAKYIAEYKTEQTEKTCTCKRVEEKQK